MDGNFRRAVQKADKYARDKNYLCLFPGCKERAIRSHAIPRSSCVEALAENGELYTRQQSLNSVMRMTSPNDPPNIVKVGVNDASVFKGYCPNHDNLLFRSAETTDRRRKNGMFIAQHLRALSVEYCRKRQVIEFNNKLSKLTNDVGLREHLRTNTEQIDFIASCFKKVYLGNLFNMIGGSGVDKIDYYCIPFSRNLQVSCCGCFDGTPGAFDSIIGYNLISYSDMTILVLTVFNAVKHHLDSLVGNYTLPRNGEKLVNDIAFLHCEEPLISTRLWLSLNETEKLSIRHSLRHPNFRTETSAPRIVKLALNDFVTNHTPLTPAMLTRLPPDFGN
jgi:hypothetical protein